MVNIIVRYCFNPECRRPITECNGFVIARDFLAFWEGRLPAEKVRELCGMCRERLYGKNEEFLALIEATQPK